MIIKTIIGDVVELARHLEILLLDNDCVIVPGLGGFVAHHVSARYDDRDATFVPPLRTLGFNPKLRLNDSLLAQSYIEAYDLSYPEAMQRIESEVDEVRQHISNEGSYEMRDIGTLYISDNGNGSLEFEPCEAGILTPDLYGLYAFDMETIDVKRRVGGKKTSSLTTAIMTAAAAIAIFAFFIASPPGSIIGDNVQMMDVGNNALTRFIMSNAFRNDAARAFTAADTVVDTTAEPAKTESGNEATAAATADDAQAETGAPTSYYTIVLASKIPLANAEAYADMLQKQGWDCAAVYNGDGDPKVVYGKYDTKEFAYSILRKLHHNDIFAEGWVFKTK